MTHWLTAVTATTTPTSTKIRKMAAKSTWPGPTIKSTASPVKMGMYKLEATVTAARKMDSATSAQ